MGRSERPGLPARCAISVVRAYQLVLRPLLPSACRFSPSCSAYAIEAVALHGAARGGWLAVRRLLRCHPWHPGGYDPPPARRAGSIASSGGA